MSSTPKASVVYTQIKEIKVAYKLYQYNPLLLTTFSISMILMDKVHSIECIIPLAVDNWFLLKKVLFGIANQVIIS